MFYKLLQAVVRKLFEYRVVFQFFAQCEIYKLSHIDTTLEDITDFDFCKNIVDEVIYTEYRALYYSLIDQADNMCLVENICEHHERDCDCLNSYIDATTD